MKRILSVISLLLVAVMLFASCNAEAHEHSFAEDWKSDDDYHWHACGVENCTEQGDKAEHSFEVKLDENNKPKNVCTVCGYTNDKVTTAPEHEHKYAEKYASNENFHWFACTVENCYEVKDKAEHSFGNPETEYADGSLTVTHTCVDCGYKKVEKSKVESTVDDATEWNEVFKSFKLTDFSIDIFLGGREDPKQTNHCVITDSAVYYCIPDSREFYAFKNEDGSYDGYIRFQGDFYIMPEDIEEDYFQNASASAALVVSFEDNFDKFTYDPATATYTSTENIMAKTITADGSDMEVLYCHHSEVKIVDGKIAYIACEYSFEENSDSVHAFTYYNIGMSQVEIPQSVIDEAKANGVANIGD